METTSVQLSEKTREELQERADEEGKSQSEIIRVALEKYLNNEYEDLEDRITKIEEALTYSVLYDITPAEYLGTITPQRITDSGLKIGKSVSLPNEDSDS